MAGSDIISISAGGNTTPPLYTLGVAGGGICRVHVEDVAWRPENLHPCRNARRRLQNVRKANATHPGCTRVIQEDGIGVDVKLHQRRFHHVMQVQRIKPRQ